ncbi:MAG TPA: NAD(P)H-dependent glycerol-3-phosphate dehydrogenase [Acidobacteriota bacterium]
MTTTAIIGAGSWGTALAIHAAGLGHQVHLWVHSSDTFTMLEKTRVNEIYLPGIRLQETVSITQDPSSVARTDYCIFAVPSPYFRETFQKFLPYLRENAVLISAIKGMEIETSKRISEIVEELSGQRYIYSVLSGPSFAKEVAQQHPTAVVLGCADTNTGKKIQNEFSSPYFRLYFNPDVTGIEVGGSVKNIIAIASGVVSGVGYGYNTLAGLITRGLAEVNRLAVKLGAHPATLAGLAGIGDLILTCTGHLSRNRQVGIAIGKGESIDQITSRMRMVAEGIYTTKAIHILAQQLGVVMPITEQVYKLIYKQQEPKTAILELMSRELKPE